MPCSTLSTQPSASTCSQNQHVTMNSLHTQSGAALSLLSRPSFQDPVYSYSNGHAATLNQNPLREIQGPKENYQYHLEVHLRVPYTIVIQGIWNHNIGNYLGPCIRLLEPDIT